MAKTIKRIAALIFTLGFIIGSTTVAFADNSATKIFNGDGSGASPCRSAASPTASMHRAAALGFVMAFTSSTSVTAAHSPSSLPQKTALSMRPI